MMDAEPKALPRWMAAALAAMLLAMLAGGAWIYRTQARAARDEVEKSLTAIGRMKVDQITTWREERLSDAAVLVESPLFGQAVARFLADPRDENIRDLRASFRSLQAHNHYADVLMVDPRGRALLSLTGGLEIDSGHTPAVVAAVRDCKPGFIDLHSGPEHVTPHINVVAPIFAGGARDGAPLGAVILVNDATQFLYPLIQSWPTASRTAETVLLRRDGDEVLFLNNLRFQADAALRLRFPLSRTSVSAVMAVLGRTGVVDGKDHRGVDVVSVLLPIPESPWFMVAKEDTAEVYADWRSREALMLALLVALPGALSAIGLFAWQRNQKAHYRALYRGEAEVRAGVEAHAVALQESELRYRRLFEAAKDGFLILDAETGVVLDVNPFLMQLLGYSHDELCGKALWDLGSFKDICASKASFETLKDREYIRYEDLPLETRDGRRIDVEFVSNVYRVEPSDVIQCNIRDISERHRAAEERERLMAAIEQAGEVVMITDPEGIIHYVNPAFETVTGYARAEALGLNPRFLKSGKQDDALYADLWRTISGGGVFRGRMVNKRKDGTLFTAEVTISPVCDATGAIVSYVAVTRDITERLRLAAQFQQAQKMESVGRLAGGVAHDFNNMLSVILGYAELALYKVPPSEPLHDDLQQILEAAKRSAEITRQLLAFAREEPIAPRVLDLNEAVEGMLKMLRRLIGEDVDLAWIPGTGLWPVRMDPSQIAQMLANLCVNARDAITDVGKITIGTSMVTLDEAYCAEHAGFVPGEFVLLAVSDDGIGMNRETLDKLFEPFFTTKAAGRGTGLGLATIYGMVKQNDGFINVYSEPGAGTTFRIYLPRHQGAIVEAGSKSAEILPSGLGETVLVVEDEVGILRLTRTMLERRGYAVLAASTTSEAMQLAAAHSHEIQLLITDVVMPDMNGRALADQLHAVVPGLKTLFMSGYTADVIAHRGVLDEGVHFVQKPFSESDLAAKVRAALGQE